MMHLTDEQVDYILEDIGARGIRLEGLRDNLLDHICILVEQELEERSDFERVYRSVLPAFYRDELYELEAEALFLASLKGPHLVLNRWLFFGVLAGILLSPYCLYVLRWGFIYVPQGAMAPAMEAVYLPMLVAFFPLVTVIVLCFTPNRFDPLIPWRSKILLGLKPFIKVLPQL